MYKFTLWPNSLPGLTVEVTVYAHTFLEAKNRVLKEIYLHKELHADAHAKNDYNPWPDLFTE